MRKTRTPGRLPSPHLPVLREVRVSSLNTGNALLQAPLQSLRLCPPALGILSWNPKLKKRHLAPGARSASPGCARAGIRLQQPPKGERKQGTEARRSRWEFAKRPQPANGPKSSSPGVSHPLRCHQLPESGPLELFLLLKKREGAPPLFPGKGS